MSAWRWGCVVVVIFPVQAAWGAGLSWNSQFTVLAADQELSDAVLARATELEAEIAKKWLGAELTATEVRTTISVHLSETDDQALSWAADHADRTLHRIWLRSSRAGVQGHVLAHEVTHTCTRIHFEGRLPRFFDEGAASLEDGPERLEIRKRLREDWVRTGKWPDLAGLFDAPRISMSDQSAYAAAASLVEFLAERQDHPTVLIFAVEGRERGWDKALQKYYRIRSVNELQVMWQRSVAASIAAQPRHVHAIPASHAHGDTTVSKSLR